MKKIFLSSIIVLAAVFAAGAATFTVGNFTFSGPYSGSTYGDNAVNIDGLSAAGSTYVQNNTTLVIPGYVTYNNSTYRVNSISNVLSNNSKVQTVQVSPGVAVIASNCFKNCTALNNLYLPSTITQINGYAFDGCSQLGVVLFAGRTVPALNANSFAGIKSTALAYVRSGTIVNKYKQNFVIRSAFANVYKNNQACDFRWNNQYYGLIWYRGAGFSNEVELLGANSAVTSVNTSAQVAMTSHSANGNNVWYYVTAIADSAFFNNSYITQLCAGSPSSNTGSNLRKIGAAAFAYCANLTTATIDADTVSQNAFLECENLATVNMIKSTYNNSTKILGSLAFRLCTSLTSFKVPAAMTTFGVGALESCTSLAAITMDAGNTTFAVRNGSLYDKSLTTLYCCPGACTSLVMPASLKTISARAAMGNTKLTTVRIPYGVTTVGGQAFYGCSSLATLYIPSSVSSIGTYAFGSCPNLGTVYSALKTIPSGNFFYGGKALSSIKLYRPLGYTYVYGTNAYSVDLYSSIYRAANYWGQMNIQSDSAAYDYELNGVRYRLDAANRRATAVAPASTSATTLPIADQFYYNGISYNTTEIADSAFINMRKAFNVTGGLKIRLIGKDAFKAKNGAYLQNFPFTNAEFIFHSAFYGQKNMNGATISLESAKTMESYAFYGCDKITTVVIGPYCPLTKGGEFAHCNNIKDAFVKYYYPSKNSDRPYSASGVSPYSFAYSDANVFKNYSSGITVWVDYRNSAALDWSYTQPFYCSDYSWQSFCCNRKVAFDALSGLSAYLMDYTSNPDASTKQMSLNRIYEYDGTRPMVINATPGEFYRLTKSAYATTMPDTDERERSLDYVLSAQYKSKSSYTGYDVYVMETARPWLRRLGTSGENVYKGEWAVAWPSNYTSSQSGIELLANSSQGGIYGDVNGDKQVTVADLTAIYDVIIGVDMQYQSTADVNNDKQVTVADVTAVYNIILGTE